MTETGQLREVLRDVIDPELGIDIVSLGLVYGREVNDRVAATTTPACPLGEYITDEVRPVLLAGGTADWVEVVITHEPAWTPEMMADDTKQAFGW
jgi:metal-sulfur cluster biosynthetic enzyme